MKALVTGASLGLGRAIATHLSRAGIKVLITARSQDGLAKTLSGLDGDGHAALAVDVSTVDGIESLLAEARTFSGGEGIDVYVNCAGAQVDPDAEAELSATDSGRITEIINVTATSALAVLAGIRSELAIPEKSFAVFLGSDWGLEGSHGPVAFSAAKSALRQMVLVASSSYIRDGIRLTLLTPGDIATYDEDWEQPKWTLDDSVDDVVAELGVSRIPISDVLAALDFVMSAKLTRITEIHLSPIDPEYQY
jgi:NAD(P)-dependent dehydrogenase (short-subunit alcohol dehydrogenase family)